MSYDQALRGHIIEIVQNQQIAEQNDLQEVLQHRGYKVPQATLSRHLKKLKIVKTEGVYKIADFQQPNLPLVLNLQISDTGLIVIQTHPGQASSIAYYLDRKYVTYRYGEAPSSGILGTVAGDDTVLLITKSPEELSKILNLIYQDFPYLKKPQS